MTIVDASVMVAFLLSADVNSNAASAWMSAQLGSNAPMSAPSILIAEVGAAVRRVADQETGEKAIRLLMTPGFIHLEPVTAELAEAAALTAVAQGLKGCDATTLSWRSEPDKLW